MGRSLMYHWISENKNIPHSVDAPRVKVRGGMEGGRWECTLYTLVPGPPGVGTVSYERVILFSLWEFPIKELLKHCHVEERRYLKGHCDIMVQSPIHTRG